MNSQYIYEKDKNWIYEQEGEQIRYVLGEIGDKMVICIGINPSTATPEKLDRTLANVKKIAQFNNYTGWTMFNVYPKRNTNPQDLPKAIDIFIHKKNLEVIANVLNNKQELDIWCAWGTLIEENDYLKDCLKDICNLFKNKNANWLCTGTTKDGHPEHPLYTSAQTKFKKFNLERYVQL